jgi:sec-independent protein translocase protein TatA
MDLGPPELILILVAVLLLFGGTKLPQLARSIGKAKVEFERAAKGEPPPDEAQDHTAASTSGSQPPQHID